jgi:hypothetical protein
MVVKLRSREAPGFTTIPFPATIMSPFLIRCENVAKMALANDEVIKTFPSDRADQPLRMSVVPRRPRRDWSVANAHGPDRPDEGSAIRASRSRIK